MRMPSFFASTFALLALTLAPASARADDSVVILGITSMEGDDELARNLTGALRHAATQVHDWQVSDSEVTLAQMSLAHGCSDEPDPTCLAQISSALAAQRVVYGLLRRDGSAFTLSLSLYNASTGEIERTVTERIPGTRTDIDDLREPARRLVNQLSGPVTGALRVASNVPNATVSIDGARSGTTDAGGAFASSEVPVGEHEVTVSASGYETWTGTVAIARGTEMTLDAQLAEAAAGGGGGGGDSINWLGISLIGVGAIALGVSIYSWARISAIQSDSNYDAYRHGWIGAPPANVCEAARMGTPNAGVSTDTVAGLCNEADTLEVLQYVFLGVAVASGAAGAVFLLTGIGGGGGGGESEQAFMLTPSFSPDGARVDARLRF